jgi:hypothetical protein
VAWFPVIRGLLIWVLLVLAFSLAWNRIEPVKSSRVAVHSTFRVCCIVFAKILLVCI